MANFSKMLGRRRDMPVTASAYLPTVAAGSAADFEYGLWAVPNLTALLPAAAGSAGDQPINSVTLRSVALLPITTLTGNATNNCLLNINGRRNLGVNTTVAATQTSGAGKVLTPASMNNIQVGSSLILDTLASGVQETVSVTAVTATTFTATLANGHTGPFIVVNSALNALLPVNTTSASTITAGAFTFTPLSMSNIAVGGALYFSGGTGAAETVIVTAVTATTATATFANGHSGAYTIVSAPLATLNFNAATTIAQAMVPTALTITANNILIGGDTLTVQRVSNNVTGLAVPNATLVFEYIPARIGG